MTEKGGELLVSIGLEKLVAIFRQEMCRIACIIQLIQEYPTRICKKAAKIQWLSNENVRKLLNLGEPNDIIAACLKNLPGGTAWRS